MVQTELYDHRRDPEESSSVHDSQPEVVANMLQWIERQSLALR